MRTALFLSSLVVCVPAYAGPVETWECAEYSQWKNILVTATVDEGRTTGAILVAGIKHSATFAVKGFDRRWDFGLAKDGSLNYAFVISPNGDGRYFDFTLANEAKPSQFMNCRQKKK